MTTRTTPTDRPDHSHVIVCGASMGGLLAARVLADHFSQVTVVERDTLPAAGTNRRGVPQGRHAHGLLAAGRGVLEQLFPGLTAELVAGGAEAGDIQRAVRWCNGGHRLRPATSGLDGLLVSRPYLEGAVRDRVRALENVEIVERCSVLGLVTDDGRRITGIRVGAADADGAKGAASVAILADLVVDASGRASRSPAWLADLGYPAPTEEEVRVDIAYATRTFRRARRQLDGDLGIIDAPSGPHGRAGVALAVEGDRWVVTLGGYGDDHPPTDPDGWLQFADGLSRPDLAALVRDAEPLDDPVGFRYPASRRRHYERLDRFPAGYLVFGDALCSFNPIYGQGMTVAALEALALDECLREASPALAGRFFRRASRLIDVPWQIAVGSDLQFEHVEARRPLKVRLVNRYLARLHVAAASDAALGVAFLRVVNLLDRPERLLSPLTAWRVLVGNLRRSPAPAPARGNQEAVAVV